MFALCSSMSPFSATSFVGRCVANSALSRTIAAHCKHPCYFVVLPPSFVSPKTASLQPAIDPELFMIMDVFMDSILAFSTALRWFRARHIYCTSKLPIGIFRTYRFEILFQQQRFSLLHCFPLGADGFVRCFFVGWKSSSSFSLSKMLRSLIPYLCLSGTFLSTLKVASVRDNTSAFFLATAAIPHSTLG